MFWGSVPFLSVLSLAFLLSITGFYEIYSDLRPWDALPLSSLIWVSCDFSKELLWFRPVGGSRVLISARFVLKQRRLFTYHQKTEKSGSFILILCRILKRYHDDMDYDDMDCHSISFGSVNKTCNDSFSEHVGPRTIARNNQPGYRHFCSVNTNALH